MAGFVLYGHSIGWEIGTRSGREIGKRSGTQHLKHWGPRDGTYQALGVIGGRTGRSRCASAVTTAERRPWSPEPLCISATLLEFVPHRRITSVLYPHILFRARTACYTHPFVSPCYCPSLPFDTMGLARLPSPPSLQGSSPSLGSTCTAPLTIILSLAVHVMFSNGGSGHIKGSFAVPTTHSGLLVHTRTSSARIPHSN